MATVKVLFYLSVSLLLGISYTNGQIYSYITNATVNVLYASVGYNPNDAPERWEAEGTAIEGALKYIDTLERDVFVSARYTGIELIVASTGGNTLTYICGLTKRLRDNAIDLDQLPSQIIIVNTLNYVCGAAAAATEYANFKLEVDRLIQAANRRSNSKIINVVVKHFQPLDELDPEFDYLDTENIKMVQTDVTKQRTAIKELHTKLKIVHQGIGAREFEKEMKSMNIMKVVDGVMGSSVEKVTTENQLLLATPTAQINAMSNVITYHTKRLDERVKLDKRAKFIVICIDNSSGMNEHGNWLIALTFPVHYILSSVWHKNLVNSGNLKGNPRKIVLDITFRGKRLVAELLTMISARKNYNATVTVKLKKDLERVNLSVQIGVITFKIGYDNTSRVVAAPD